MRIPHHAKKSVSRDSAVPARLGMKTAYFRRQKEQFSYFRPLIAPEKKIISLGPIGFTRSTDHVDNNKLAEGAPLLPRLAFTGYLGGHRRGAVHSSRRRGHLPARSLVIHVARDHRRRATTVASAPLRRAATRSRAAVCHRLFRQAD